jgi:hypothetical protein
MLKDDDPEGNSKLLEHAEDDTALTDEGYQAVVAMHDDDNTNSFVRKVVQDEALIVTDEEGLSGFANLCNSYAKPTDKGVMSMDTLRRMLRTAFWVSPSVGRTAPLTWEGYQTVVFDQNKAEVKAFARRLLWDGGFGIGPGGEVALSDLARVALQGAKFDTLKSKLLSDRFPQTAAAQKAEGNAELINTEVAGAENTEQGFQKVVSMRDEAQMTSFVRKVAQDEAFAVVDEQGLRGVVNLWNSMISLGSMPGQGTMSLDMLKRMVDTAFWVNPTVGRTANLTWRGYQRVLFDQSEADVRFFARRVLENAGYKVAPGGELKLNDLVRVSMQGGATFEKLESELLSDTFPKTVAKNSTELTTETHENTSTTNARLLNSVNPVGESGVAEHAEADDTALTEDGYQSVLTMKDDEKMTNFVREIAQDEAYAVVDEKGLSGFVKLCSSVDSTTNKAVMSLDTVRRMLRAAFWVAPSVGRTAPLSWEGYQTVQANQSAAELRAFTRRVLEDAGYEVASGGEPALSNVVHKGMQGTKFEEVRSELLSDNFPKTAAAKKPHATVNTELATAEIKVMPEESYMNPVLNAVDPVRDSGILEKAQPYLT